AIILSELGAAALAAVTLKRFRGWLRGLFGKRRKGAPPDKGTAPGKDDKTPKESELPGEKDAPRGVPFSPSKPVKGPNLRHNLDRITQKTPVHGEINTIIRPGVNVADDVAAINAGRAVRVGNETHVNGRVYGIHSETGRLFPIRGDGFVPLTRNEFKAVGVLRTFADDLPRAESILRRMHGMTDADIAIAKELLGL
ncbi:MAG: hypothetical protein WD049_07325, partial [Candidatus Paceibacterota bacterium]